MPICHFQKGYALIFEYSSREKRREKKKKKKKKRANNHHLNYGQIYIFRVLQVFSLGLRLSRNITSSFKFND